MELPSSSEIHSKSSPTPAMNTPSKWCWASQMDSAPPLPMSTYLPTPPSTAGTSVMQLPKLKLLTSSQVTAAPVANHTLACGDFNVRCGTRAPRVGEVKLDRRSEDEWECPRAPWFIRLCEEAELHVLNGAAPQPPAQHTYHGTMGQSCVDYFLGKDPRQII